MPPIVKSGDIVKVLQHGTSYFEEGEFTVVHANPDYATVEREGKQSQVLRSKLVLTISPCKQDILLEVPASVPALCKDRFSA